MLDMEAIKNFSIDKSDWKKVKFGDVVFEPKESVKDLVSEGIEHVVGLEHIDSEDMDLRRSASIEESTTFTKKFSKGDVLFGRRRAYLKKAAKAIFGGICSGDITVMRAKDDVLLPELLPFIVSNDEFFDHAVQHSAGGLSPRVKFKDLENFEFSLPSLQVQKQLAPLLISMMDVIKNENNVAEKLQNFYLAKMYELLNGRHITSSGAKLPKNWKETKLQDIAKFIDYRGKTPNKTKEGIRLITAKNIRDGWIDKEPEEFIAEDDYTPWMRRGIPNKGDVLFTTEAPLGNTAIIDLDEKFALAQRAICLQPYEDISGEFLFFALNNPIVKQRILARSSGTTVSGIRSALLKEVTIPVPTGSEREKITTTLKDIVSSMKMAQENYFHSKSLMKTIIKQVF
ncbi:restriction endonuclease subunit S [uncultured Psychrosphaera sp.]|uniref:restriction endonuclease subunit S n=1 Tax=uncultured Psychrosphaera sp. TaxID=1403522 RepID=UPI002623B186|nr:restriction endonuclease subunit S [uncultured Psychrosphaera sp.]